MDARLPSLLASTRPRIKYVGQPAGAQCYSPVALRLSCSTAPFLPTPSPFRARALVLLALLVRRRQPGLGGGRNKRQSGNKRQSDTEGGSQGWAAGATNVSQAIKAESGQSRPGDSCGASSRCPVLCACTCSCLHQHRRARSARSICGVFLSGGGVRTQGWGGASYTRPRAAHAPTPRRRSRSSSRGRPCPPSCHSSGPRHPCTCVQRAQASVLVCTGTQDKGADGPGNRASLTGMHPRRPSCGSAWASRAARTASRAVPSRRAVPSSPRTADKIIDGKFLSAPS